jgi:hypothetical protein
VPIADITLIVRYADPQGALRQVRRVIGEPLAPNGTLRLSTGLGPFTSQQAYEVAIESARAVTQ